MAKWGEIKCPRCEELEAKLAKVTAAYRIEVMQRGPWVSHEDFDRHIREITGDHKLAQQDDLVQAAVAAAKGESDDRVQN